MTDKSKTYSTQWALEESVTHCTHPDLDATDAFLLWKIAHHCKHATGRGARAGNRDMVAVLRVCERTIQRRIKKIARLGLLECTARGDGRGKASEYRICLESDFYPPEKPRHNSDAVSEENPDTQGAKPRQSEPETPTPVTEKGDTAMSHQQEPTQSNKNTTHTCGALCSFSEATRYLPPEMLTGWKKDERAALETLASKHGWEKIVLAVRCFWERQPDSAERTIFK